MFVVLLNCSSVAGGSSATLSANGGLDPKQMPFRRSSNPHANTYTVSSGTGGNVYNVSSATLTSYTSYSDGDSLDNSLPSYLTNPVKNGRVGGGQPGAGQRSDKENKFAAKEAKVLTMIRNILIVLALALHSVFEGMAIGESINKQRVLINRLLLSARHPSSTPGD